MLSMLNLTVFEATWMNCYGCHFFLDPMVIWGSLYSNIFFFIYLLISIVKLNLFADQYCINNINNIIVMYVEDLKAWCSFVHI